jgi:hypothetical protein
MRPALFAALAALASVAAQAQNAPPSPVPRPSAPLAAPAAASDGAGQWSAPGAKPGDAKIYKGVDARGRVTYSSMPVPGGRSVSPQPLSSGVAPYEGYRAATPPAAAPAAPGSAPQPPSRRDAIAKAADNLARAETAQAQGVEPLPGERLGTANGGTRFSPAYDQRQAQLAAAVEQARQQLESAQSGN